jgi:hypothetical protein
MNDYNKKIEKLKDEINELENILKEKKSSLPAHSIKPDMIQKIEDLEEELASKKAEIKKIKFH